MTAFEGATLTGGQAREDAGGREIEVHNSWPGLDADILSALQASGRDIDALSREDIQAFDELHISGVLGTRALADLAALQEGWRMLDIGCGLGGPARTLAAEYGCLVTGLDLSDSFVQAAEMLTLRLGLADRVSFRPGDALNLPFPPQSFDVVWLQYVTASVPDRARLFREAGVILRPSGLLAVHEPLAGPVEPLHYPHLWAADARSDSIAEPPSFRRQAAAAGFRQMEWRDVTRQEVAWHQAAGWMVADAAWPAGLARFVTAMAERGRNGLRDIVAGRISVIQAVYRKEGLPMA